MLDQSPRSRAMADAMTLTEAGYLGEVGQFLSWDFQQPRRPPIDLLKIVQHMKRLFK